jgi:sulfur transfer complex TusBCD TusB component (DsrH family)
MEVPKPTLPSHHRGKIAQLQRENRQLNEKMSKLLLLLDAIYATIAEAVITIESHKHNDKALMLLEADLSALNDAINFNLLEALK